jgi:hypothetical protein
MGRRLETSALSLAALIALGVLDLRIAVAAEPVAEAAPAG